MTRELRPCGTEAAYTRHLAYDEPTDPECRRAHADRINAGRGYQRREIPPCGTRRAHHRHRRLGEPIDLACYDANAAYQREWRAKRKQRRAAAEVPAEGVPR